MESDGSEIALRLAREADAGEIARLSGQLGYPIDGERARARLRDASADHAVIVAESGGRVAGLIELRRIRAVMAWRQVEIVALVVDDGHRGRGIGSRLIEEAERWAYDLRCGKVRVRSDALREEAHSLYRARGYEATRTEMLFEKQLGAVRPKAARFVPTSIASSGASNSRRGETALSIARVAVAALLVVNGAARAAAGGVSDLEGPLAEGFLGPALGWGVTAAEILGGLALAFGGRRGPLRRLLERRGRRVSPSSPSP
jgi:GNAT superfamily N-acetyltransferase